MQVSNKEKLQKAKNTDCQDALEHTDDTYEGKIPGTCEGKALCYWRGCT